MLYAVIENGVVDNIIVAGKNFKPEDNMVLIKDEIVCIGYLYDGEKFIVIDLDNDKAV